MTPCGSSTPPRPEGRLGGGARARDAPKRLGWSPDGKRIALALDAVAGARRRPPMSVVHELDGHSGTIMDAYFAGPNRDLVWTAGRDGTAVAFDLSGARTPITTADCRLYDPRSAPTPLSPGTEASTRCTTRTGPTRPSSSTPPPGAISASSPWRTSASGSTAALPGHERGHHSRRHDRPGRATGIHSPSRPPIATPGSRCFVGHRHPDGAHGAAPAMDPVRHRGHSGWHAGGAQRPPRHRGGRPPTRGPRSGSRSRSPRCRTLTTPWAPRPPRTDAGLLGARRRDLRRRGRPPGESLSRGKVVESDYLVQAIAWSADSATIAAGSSNGWLHFLVAETLEPAAPRRLITGGWVTELEVSRDGRLMASVGTDGDVTLWDTATWRPYGQPVTHGPRLGVGDLPGRRGHPADLLRGWRADRHLSQRTRLGPGRAALRPTAT